MDIIFLRHIPLQTIIGYYDWEQQRLSTLQLDLDVALPNTQKPFTDELEETINYDALVKKLQTSVVQAKFKLIETLAEHIAKKVQTEFHAPWVKVSITKPGVFAGASIVGVSIERGHRT